MKRTRHSAAQIVTKLRDADGMLAAGRTIGEVCQALGISEPSFYAWRRTLRERDRRRPATERGPRLVPLRVIAEPVLEVVLPAGVVVRVPAGANATAVATVAQLVAALGTASC